MPSPPTRGFANGFIPSVALVLVAVVASQSGLDLWLADRIFYGIRGGQWLGAAHFLSHDLCSAAIARGVAILLYELMLCERERIARRVTISSSPRRV